MREGGDPQAAAERGERPFGRAIADFRLPDGVGPSGLLPAEEILLALCREGRPCSFGRALPTEPTGGNSIRPDFLRFLALGGDSAHPVHENGVQLEGAWIDGDITLDHAREVLPISLRCCRIDGRFSAFNAKLTDLALSGSSLKGVVLEDAVVDGSVLLREGAHVDGETRLTGTRIEGDLDCASATLSNPRADALAARHVHIRRSVFISDGFTAHGRVRFAGAHIGGDFACHGGRFIQKRKDSGEQHGRYRRAAEALTLVNAHIEGVLWLGPWATRAKEQVDLQGSLNLQGARAETFVDHQDSWPPVYVEGDEGRLYCVVQLNGFVYDKLGTGAPTDSATREKWLLQQQPKRRRTGDFHPQPFEQLMRVLRAMGYDQDARRIGLLKESLMQPTRVHRATFWSRPLVLLTGYAWGTLAGYGYRSHRLFVFLLLLWLGCAWFFGQAEAQGLFAPADAGVWTNADLVRECEQTRWTVCPKVSGFITFNAAMYAADVIFPFIDLQQQAQWIPLMKPFVLDVPGIGPAHLPAGTVHLVAWIATMIGTACVVLLGAILTGLLHRE